MKSTTPLPPSSRTLASAFALALVALPTAGATGPWSETPEARVRLVSGWESAPPPSAVRGSTPLDLGVEFVLAPGWHVYWKNSGDAGYAPKIDFAATPAIQGAELLFPAPHRFDLPGGLVSFGYEKEVIYPVAGTLSRTASGPLTIAARLDYLACATECLPHTAELRLELPDEPANSTATTDDAARLDLWRSRVPQPMGVAAGGQPIEVRIERLGSGLSLVLTASAHLFRGSSPDLFFESHEAFGLGRPVSTLEKSGITFRVPIHPLDETKPLPGATEFAWTLTGLDGEAGPYALAGTSRVAIPGPEASPLLWRVGPFVVAVAAFFIFLASRFRSLRARDERARLETP